MNLTNLLQLAAPALAIICVAVVITVRERRGHDVVLDLTDDVPCVRLSENGHGTHQPPESSAPVTGDLVAATGASLGARLQHVAAAEQEAARSPVVEQPRQRLVVRRRRAPLVAGSHTDSSLPG